MIQSRARSTEPLAVRNFKSLDGLEPSPDSADERGGQAARGETLDEDEQGARGGAGTMNGELYRQDIKWRNHASDSEMAPIGHECIVVATQQGEWYVARAGVTKIQGQSIDYPTRRTLTGQQCLDRAKENAEAGLRSFSCMTPALTPTEEAEQASIRG